MAFTNPRGRTQTSLSEINITPFVDVVLVLLIIFMLTAPILESGIEVDLPKTKTVKIVSEEKVVITIDKKQNIYVGNDPVNIHRLGVTVLDQLKGAGTQPVFIRCDQNVSFGAFARVVDALKQANLTNLNIVTEPLETKPGQSVSVSNSCLWARTSMVLIGRTPRQPARHAAAFPDSARRALCGGRDLHHVGFHLGGGAENGARKAPPGWGRCPVCREFPCPLPC